jgi:acetyl-CoA carboxylase carboxyltransferase component
MSDRLEELRRRHARAEAGGGEERRERQHAEGKLSARERIDLLLDIPPPSEGSTLYNKSPRSI